MRCTPTDTSLLELLPPRVCVSVRPITTAKGRARLLERRRTRRGRRTPGSGVARRELGELESHVPKRRPVVKSHAPIGEAIVSQRRDATDRHHRTRRDRRA
ncbi:hypothetical protein ZHAS_00013225 [Anopheles sinensis]|uniref:Uncharacterized protein n=1 Tax=Anopheles sinensis TaxID=74873 RepID=A0A084W591_ANOSI|nr:hypothetical protein ZHAS_00013225 [Anopheles sinensis]